MTWIDDPEFAADRPFGPQTLPYGVLVTASVVIALVAGPLAGVSRRAAEDLMHGGPYRSAVLGVGHE